MAVYIRYWDLRCEKCGDGQKRVNGCEENSYEPNRWQIGEWTWQRCPVKLITQETISFINAYGFLQKGILPYQQGYKRNSNRYVEAMQIINREIIKHEMNEAKQRVNKR